MVAFSCGRLPEDLLTEEILLKLPAKSLLRFKSVNKRWHAIISSPSFVKKHHFNGDTDRGLVLYCKAIKLVKNTPKSCFYSYFPDADATGLRHDVPDHLLLWGEITYIRGPCNGIFCIHSRDNKFALWNPTTRRMRLIQCSPSFLFDEVGFGVDPLTGDFKIVLICCVDGVSSSFAVYSSTTHSWRYLEQEESLTDTKRSVDTKKCSSNTFLNGYYYWSKHSLPDYASTIFAFDMQNEIFEEIETPVIKESQTPGQLHLLNDNSLAFVSQFQTDINTKIQIWLMEEKGQWTLSSYVCVPFVIMDVVGFWGRGNKMLLRFFANDIPGLLMLDLDSLDIILLEIKLASTYVQYEFISLYYKESLFAVKGEDGVEDHDIRSPESLEHLGYQGQPLTNFGCRTFKLVQRGKKYGIFDLELGSSYYSDESEEDETLVQDAMKK